ESVPANGYRGAAYDTRTCLSHSHTLPLSEQERPGRAGPDSRGGPSAIDQAAGTIVAKDDRTGARRLARNVRPVSCDPSSEPRGAPLQMTTVTPGTAAAYFPSASGTIGGAAWKSNTLGIRLSS